jgi:ribosomal protein L37AE/L43A
MICKLARKYIRREISEIWVCDGAEAVDKGGKAAELAGLAADSVSRG